MIMKRRKVVVIGAGSVGTTYIYAMLHTGLASEIALIDIDRKRVEGEVMDLSHGLPFIPPLTIKQGEYTDCSDAQIIVVTAGAKQEPGQTRTELIRKNADIIRSICSQIAQQDSEAVLIMVTNPVDTLTQVALDYLKWPKGRVIGSGTVLDTARLKYMLSEHCGIDARNIHAYVIGEHGDSEVVPWTLAHIAGIPIKKYCEICKGCDSKKQHSHIVERVRKSAYHIIDYKGATFYGIGLSLIRISSAVLRNEKSVLTVSTKLDGEYDIEDICLSVPCIVGENGVESVIYTKLQSNEQQDLENSADVLRKVLENVSS